MKSKFVTTAEGRIEFFEHGNPTGIPLLMLHGFPDAPAGFDAVIAQLDLKKLHLYVPYLRGFGGTEIALPDLVGGQKAALGQDVLSFADALGLRSFHLLAHDWGNSAAFSACVFAPERVQSLVALASPYVMYKGEPYPPAQVRAYWYQTFFQLAPAKKMLDEHPVEFCEELWRAWSPHWKYGKGEFREAAKAWGGKQFTETVLHYYRMRWGNTLTLRAYAELQTQLDVKPTPKIQVPTTFLHGQDDHCVLPEALAGHATYFSAAYDQILLKGVGHFPHREDPRAVARAVTRMLARHG